MCEFVVCEVFCAVVSAGLGVYYPDSSGFIVGCNYEVVVWVAGKYGSGCVWFHCVLGWLKPRAGLVVWRGVGLFCGLVWSLRECFKFFLYFLYCLGEGVVCLFGSGFCPNCSYELLGEWGARFFVEVEKG